MVGAELAFGLGYRRTSAELRQRYPQVPVAVTAGADRFDEATLDELRLTGNWNSPSGWFARTEAGWHAQTLASLAGGRANASPSGDRFWQFDAQLGRRFRHNLCEVSAGVLNLTDRDYRLSPLTSTRALPRARTLIVHWRVSF